MLKECSQSQGKSKQAVMVEMISALETVKTVQGISMLRNRWLNSVIHQGKSTTKTKFTSQLAMQFFQFCQQSSQVIIVVYGVFLIADGGLTMGQLIACVILSGRTMAPLGQLTGLLGKMNSALSAYKGLDEILGTPSEEEESAEQVALTCPARRSLAVRQRKYVGQQTELSLRLGWPEAQQLHVL